MMNEGGEINVSLPEIATKDTEPPKKIGSPLWNAKSLVHRQEGYSGHVNGWGISELTHFWNTPYKMKVPIKRNLTRPEVRDELANISDETLSKELFPDFFRHVDMLLSFDSHPALEASIGTIIERTAGEGPGFAESVYPHDEKKKRLLAADLNLRMLACLEMASENPSFRLDQKYVFDLYRAGVDGGHPTFLPYAMFFDERNKKEEKDLGLQERFEESITPRLLSTEEQDNNPAEYLPNFLIGAESLYSDLLTYALLRADTDEQMVSVLQKLAPQMGVERIRNRLREYVGDNEAFRPKFDKVFTYFGFDPKEAQVSLKDVYTNIDFAHYQPNEENQKFEEDLLLKEFQGKKEVVDIACGTGRLIDAIDGQNSLKVHGIDMMPKHIAAIKERDPRKDVQVGSWFSMPFAEKSFDAAYCLGRSATHNTTIPDFLAFLQEARRVIKDDGEVIMDLPESTKGVHKEHIERTKNIVKAKKLHNVLPGLITDSPDLEHFFDRYVPDERAFNALALLAGFHAEKITTKKYHSVSGEEEANIYWKLKKTVPVPEDAYFLLLGDIYREEDALAAG